LFVFRLVVFRRVDVRRRPLDEAAVFLRPFPVAAVFRGRPRRRVVVVDVAPILRGRPGRGFRAPAVSSVTCCAQRSFTKLPRDVLIVTISVAGFPHTSHTTIVFSAMDEPPSPGR
jgi:hypothetical protein